MSEKRQNDCDSDSDCNDREASERFLAGKDAALAELEQRRANPPERIDNASLYAGSPMYYYCKLCGWLAETLPEEHNQIPKQLCAKCQQLRDKGWA